MTQGASGSRIGVLGGTLDPIHTGHIETALAAKHALNLGSVVLMPARVPPHRQRGPSASAFHRFAMAALAVNGLAGVSVSDDELTSEGPSYTAVTLERLAARGIAPSRLFFITGADTFADIETWYHYPAVLDLANFIVISRPGAAVGTLADRVPALRPRLRDAILPDRPLDTTSVFLVDARTPDVSSTEIRRRLRAGEGVGGLVPALVETHIRQHHLYVETPTADQWR